MQLSRSFSSFFNVGSGGFRPSFFSGGLTIAAGVSGGILSLTAPAKKKVRLTGLFGGESGISITADGVPVITSLTLDSVGSGVNGFVVGRATASSSTSQPGLIDYIEADSTIVVSKAAGSTAGNVQYSYAYGA